MVMIVRCGVMGGGECTGYFTGIDDAKEKSEQPAPQ